MELHRKSIYTESELGGVEITYTDGEQFCSVKIDQTLSSDELRTIADLLSKIAEQIPPRKQAEE